MNVGELREKLAFLPWDTPVCVSVMNKNNDHVLINERVVPVERLKAVTYKCGIVFVISERDLINTERTYD